MLGCDMPMLIRPVDESKDEFGLIGICFVPGLLDGERLLGPLPDNWKLQMIFKNGSYVPTYINTSTGNSQPEDPRLPPLDPNWVKITRERTQDDPYFFQWFKDQERGLIMNSDPRLLPTALEKRGVVLDYFKLVISYIAFDYVSLSIQMKWLIQCSYSHLAVHKD